MGDDFGVGRRGERRARSRRMEVKVGRSMDGWEEWSLGGFEAV